MEAIFLIPSHFPSLAFDMFGTVLKDLDTNAIKSRARVSTPRPCRNTRPELVDGTSNGNSDLSRHKLQDNLTMGNATSKSTKSGSLVRLSRFFCEGLPPIKLMSGSCSQHSPMGDSSGTPGSVGDDEGNDDDDEDDTDDGAEKLDPEVVCTVHGRIPAISSTPDLSPKSSSTTSLSGSTNMSSYSIHDGTSNKARLEKVSLGIDNSAERHAYTEHSLMNIRRVCDEVNAGTESVVKEEISYYEQSDEKLGTEASTKTTGVPGGVLGKIKESNESTCLMTSELGQDLTTNFATSLTKKLHEVANNMCPLNKSATTTLRTLTGAYSDPCSRNCPIKAHEYRALGSPLASQLKRKRPAKLSEQDIDTEEDRNSIHSPTSTSDQVNEKKPRLSLGDRVKYPHHNSNDAMPFIATEPVTPVLPQSPQHTIQPEPVPIIAPPDFIEIPRPPATPDDAAELRLRTLLKAEKEGRRVLGVSEEIVLKLHEVPNVSNGFTEGLIVGVELGVWKDVVRWLLTVGVCVLSVNYG